MGLVRTSAIRYYREYGDDGKEEVFGLAICKYEDSDNFYHFSCDKNREIVQDSLYNSIDNAIRFLPEQYKNVERNWLTI